DFIAPGMRMLNGGLEFSGVAGMREHYERRIWPFFDETVHVLNFISDEALLAVQMWTHFDAKHDAPETLFGPVVTGDAFDFRGLVLYELEDGKFSRITVAYNSFVRTGVDGSVRDLGMPH